MQDRYSIKMNGIDITNFVREKPALIERKSGLGELIELPNLDFEADNTQNIWTPNHPNAILLGDWGAEPVQVYDTHRLMYEGEVRNILLQSDPPKASIQTTARINRILNAQMPPYQSGLKTLAEHSREMYQSFGVTTDALSYERTIALQQEKGYQARASITLNHNLTLMQAQQWLANAGFCRHYFIGALAYMEYDPYATERYPLHTFTDEDLFEVMSYQKIERQSYNGFEVIQTGGIITRQQGSYMVPTLDGNDDKPFVLPIGFGTVWGIEHMDRSNQTQYSIRLAFTRSPFSQWIGLNTCFTIQSTGLGIHQTFDVMSLDRTSENSILVEGISI